MAGFGKNSRGGKRGSSSSSYASTVTMVVFVAFCLLGLWMLTSSSIIPSQATTSSVNHRHTRAAVSFSSTDHPPSRFVLRDPPPAHLPEDAVKGDSEDEEEAGSRDSGQEDQGKENNNSEHSDDSSDNQQQQQRQGEEEKTHLSEEETQQGQGQEQEQEQAGENDERNQQQKQEIQENKEEENGVNGEDQQPSEDNSNGGTDDSQQMSEENHFQSEEQQQSDGQSNGEQQNSDEEQQQSDGQSNDEQQQNSNEEQQQQQSDGQSNDEQQQMGISSEDNQQDSHQQQLGETENDENQQQNHTEMDENQDQIQQQIDEGMGQSQPQSEEHTEEGGGITSQSQIEHDTDGTSDDHQQQQQQESSQQQQLEEESNIGGNGEGQQSDPNASDSLPDGVQSELQNESRSKKRTWATQADQSENEKERLKGEESSLSNGGVEGGSEGNGQKLYGYEWELCNVTAGPDYIPCLDNEKAIKKLHSLKHYEHRERHCPEESPTCLVPLPKGYRRSIEWPKSRDRIWYNNVPHTKLAEVKGHQNWVKVMGEYLTFPGGGTQFIHGALHYIDFIQQSVRAIAWGKHTRVILDVGCGVASFGGYLFERDVLTMSFAPKDEHEAQVQFALERGIPAISAVMGSQRLPFPSRVFDVVHCARCRVPWHANGGALLLELNRVLRPGGFFVWSATPVYQKLKEDVEIWKAMTSLTISMCWDLYTIKKDRLNSVGAAFYRKPISNECYDNRKHNSPPMCREDDDPNAAWYVPLQSCMHRLPVDPSERGSQWPEEWPHRLQVPPYWLNSSQMGVYNKPAPDDFKTDYEHWKRVLTKSYLSGFGIDWSKVRNVMDMRAVYGGFAAALKDMKVWVMNVVNVDSPDTLPIIYERGLFGIYHDWCESFSTYPRTYDLLHADRLFSRLKQRCEIVPVMGEVDRIVRPGGKLIVRDESRVVSEVENLLKSMHWEIRLTFSKDQEGILCAEKSDWRPEKFSASS